MPQNLKTIIPLKSGATAIMLSKYDNLVRTGVPYEKSSFIHAILTSYSKRYRDMDDNTKKKYISEFRSKIGDDLSLEEWLQDIEPNKTIHLINSRIRDAFVKIYRYLDDKIHESKIDSVTMKILSEYVLPYRDYFKNIISIMPIKKLDKVHLSSIFASITSRFHHDDVKKTYKTEIVDSLVSKFLNELNKVQDIENLHKTIYNNFKKIFYKSSKKYCNIR